MEFYLKLSTVVVTFETFEWQDKVLYYSRLYVNVGLYAADFQGTSTQIPLK